MSLVNSCLSHFSVLLLALCFINGLWSDSVDFFFFPPLHECFLCKAVLVMSEAHDVDMSL